MYTILFFVCSWTIERHITSDQGQQPEEIESHCFHACFQVVVGQIVRVALDTEVGAEGVPLRQSGSPVSTRLSKQAGEPPRWSEVGAEPTLNGPK